MLWNVYLYAKDLRKKCYKPLDKFIAGCLIFDPVVLREKLPQNSDNGFTPVRLKQIPHIAASALTGVIHRVYQEAILLAFLTLDIPPDC